MSIAPRLEDQCRFERTDTSLAGSLSTGDGTSACVVIDISAGGARVEVDLPLRDAKTVDLAIGAFDPILGDVAWSRDGALGIRFTDSTDKVAEILAGIAIYG